jgi:integrase
MARKRGQNEGSIYQRKDGLWTVAVTVQGKRISKYFKSQSECREWLRNTQSQIQNGLTLAGARTTVIEFLEQWLGTIRESVRPKTLHQYAQIARGHIAPRLGNIKLKDLRPDQIQGLYNEKLDKGVSARTVLLIHSVLHKALNQALNLGLIGRNPAQAVSRPKAKRKEMRILTSDQARTFLSVAEETRYRALFHLALHTGMREGELLGLKWEDLDWVTRQLQVKRQLQVMPGIGMFFAEPKTASGRRTIVLSKAMIEKLREHLDDQDQDRQQAGEKWRENGLIFPTTIGTPMAARNMYEDFRKLLKSIGLPVIRFHDLRHTAATLMLQQGVHPKIVQERLGHADISMTLNTYSHVLPSMQAEAAEKLDELLNPIEVSKEIKYLREAEQVYSTLPSGK